MKNYKTISPFIISFLILSSGCGNGGSENHQGSAEQQQSNDITGKFNLPPLVKEDDPAILQSGFIYPLENRPTPQVHASTLVETADGLVAAFFAGTHERHPDVGIRVSRLEGESWSRPVEVANGVQNDSLRYPCWNPVLFQPQNGPLMLFYKVGPDPRTWWGMLITSDDDGKTWSAPRRIGEDPHLGPLMGPIKNKPVQLSNGTIISPSSVEIVEGDDTRWMVHFEISEDQGETWEVVGPINDGEAFDAIQPSILIHEDGSLQALCRTRQDVIAESWSRDQGKTWSEMEATALPNPNSGTDALTLEDGRHLLIYNHSTKEGEEPKGRNILNLAISEDGKGWKPVMTLENVPIESGYAYPAIIQSSDGLVHLTYTYNRETVKYMVINPALL